MTVTGVCAVQRVMRGGVGTMDLTIYHSALCGSFQHRIFFTSLFPKGMMLFQHFDPIVLGLLPFYWIFGGSAWPVLPISMAIAGGMVIPAAARLGRIEGLSPRLSLAVPLLLMTNVALHNIVWYDFHPFIFALPLLVWGWVFLRDGRTTAGALCWIIAMLCKENVALTVAGLGLSLALRGRHRAGLAFFAGGVLAFIVIVGWIIPHFREIGAGSPYWERYGWMGGNAGQIAMTLLTRPFFVATHLIHSGAPAFLWKIFLPLGLLPLLSPRLWLAMTPELAILMLSDFHPMQSLKFHYPAALLAVLIVASVDGLRLLNHCGRWGRAARRISLIVGLIASLLTLYTDGRTLPFLKQPRIHGYYKKDPRRQQIEALAEMIPHESSISLPYMLLNPIYPFVERPLIAFLPDRIEMADYVVFDLRSRAYGGWKEPGLDEAFERLRRSSEHELIFSKKGLRAFHRKQRAITDPSAYLDAWRREGKAG